MTDPRFDAFVAAGSPDIFHSVLSSDDVWRSDPLDVPAVHAEGRAAFDRMVDRVIERRERGESVPIASRIMLLTGAAGTGKTHLMRAFRSGLHRRGRGFFAYLQMGVNVADYPRYIVHNILESLSRPYNSEASPQSSLEHLSRSLVAEAREHGILGADPDAGADLDPETIAHELADRVAGFADVEPGIVSALVHMHRGLPSVSKCATKYLRCEDLTPRQRALLGGLPPLTDPEAPSRVIHRLADVVGMTFDRPLVICIDQLDLFYSDDADAGARFRTAVASLEALADHPNIVVVLSVLDDYYVRLRESLITPQIERLEGEVTPIRLDAGSRADEIGAVLAHRLDFLYRSAGVAIDTSEPYFPFSNDVAEQLAGPSIRRALQAAHDARERSRATGERPGPFVASAGAAAAPASDPSELDRAIAELDVAWNDFRFATSVETPDGAHAIEELIEGAVRLGNRELGRDLRASAEMRDAHLHVTCERAGEATLRAFVAVTNQRPMFGRLAREVRRAVARAEELGLVPILVRSDPFPRNRGTQLSALLTDVRSRGARLVAFSDDELRTIVSFRAFDLGYGGRPSYDAWLERSKPVTSLPAMIALLGLDGVQLERPRPEGVERRSRDRTTPRHSARRTEPDPAPLPALAFDDGAAVAVPKTTIAPELEFVPLASNGNGNGHAHDHGDGGTGGNGASRNGKLREVAVVVASEPHDVDATPLDSGATSLDLGARANGDGRFALELAALGRHIAILGGAASGTTTLAFALVEGALASGIPVILIDRTGDFATYAQATAWERPLDDAAAQRRARLRDAIDVALYTPGNALGRNLSIATIPAGLDALAEPDRERELRLAAEGLGSLMQWNASKNTKLAVLLVAMTTLARVRPGRSHSLNTLIDYLAAEEPELIEAMGKLDVRLIPKIVADLATLQYGSGYLLDGDAEVLDVERLLTASEDGRATTRLSIVSTNFLHERAQLFWVSRFLSDLGRFASRRPQRDLRALVLFDGAEIYFPANAKPTTKAPLEALFASARAAGIGLALATQSPGDLDAKSKEHLATYLVGRLNQPQGLRKLADVFGMRGMGALAKVPQLKVGHFYGITETTGTVPFVADLPTLLPEPMDETTILDLARAREVRP